MLTENQKFFLDSGTVVFENHDVVDTLLELLLVFLLKCIDVKDKQVPIVASDPRKVVVHAATEKAMARCFPYDLGL